MGSGALNGLTNLIYDAQSCILEDKSKLINEIISFLKYKGTYINYLFLFEEFFTKINNEFYLTNFDKHVQSMINFFIFLNNNKSGTKDNDCLKNYGKVGLVELSDGFDHTNPKVFELYYNYIKNTKKIIINREILDEIKVEFLECIKHPCSNQPDCNNVYETQEEYLKCLHP
tara:strand:+ start:69 stop:584 length:516 start_codon:yes stop_codon:yes gene_type:complete